MKHELRWFSGVSNKQSKILSLLFSSISLPKKNKINIDYKMKQVFRKHYNKKIQVNRDSQCLTSCRNLSKSLVQTFVVWEFGTNLVKRNIWIFSIFFPSAFHRKRFYLFPQLTPVADKSSKQLLLNKSFYNIEGVGEQTWISKIIKSFEMVILFCPELNNIVKILESDC